MLNVLMLGVGQCGNRILDAVNKESFGGTSRLAKYYSRQKFPSRVETLAINTAVNDLKELRFTAAKDRLHVPNPTVWGPTGTQESRGSGITGT